MGDEAARRDEAVPVESGASSSGEVAAQAQPADTEAYATRMARQKREMEEEEEREFQRRRQQEYEDCVADANAKWEECQAMVTNLMGGRALGPGVGGWRSGWSWQV